MLRVLRRKADGKDGGDIRGLDMDQIGRLRLLLSICRNDTMEHNHDDLTLIFDALTPVTIP